jgi:streptogramin lyase
VPMNLTVGADGNIWFTDTTGYVGFVSLTACASSSGCKAFEYNVGGTPWGIAAGADGDMWFTFSSPDSSGNNIGKVVLQ